MKVSNWDKWQTFRKDRGAPPWIKVYRNLLSNQEWVSLSDKEKGQLISIWILAADRNGEIPDDPAIIQRMCMLDTKLNINKFIDLGFVTPTCQPDGNHKIITPPQDDAPEESRGEQRRAEESRGEQNIVELKPDNVQVVFDHWREKMNHPNAALDDKRKKIIKVALKHYPVDQLKQAIDGCKLTPWFMGDNDRNTIYDGLHIVFKDANRIDEFIANAERPPNRPGVRTIEDLQKGALEQSERIMQSMGMNDE